MIALIAVAAGVVAYAVHRHDGGPASQTLQPTACASATPSAVPIVLPQPSEVSLVLLNGTSRNGLAKSVGQALTARGFVVADAATAPAALPGASRIVWGPGGQPGAMLLAQQVTGAQLVGDPKAPANSVQLTLGSDFQQLADPVAAATAEPVPSTSPSRCASIRP
jgi:hypothetical protein